MIIAITGGTGFVGQAVLDKAVQGGFPVRALTRRDQKSQSGIDWVRGDLSNKAALSQLVRGCDAVLHIAGVVNASDTAGFHAGNVAGTEAIVAASCEAGCTRFICVSSLAAREPELSQYGRSKLHAEEVVRASGLDWTIVRPPAVYGPRDTELLDLFKAARWHFVPVPPPGRTSIIHVADLARVLLDVSSGREGVLERVFEPDDGRPGGWDHRELAQAIGRAMGRRVWSPNVPSAVLKGAAQLDRLFRGPSAKLSPDRARYMVHPDWVSDPANAVPAALWQPQVPIAQGLTETARWYREAGWL